MLKVKRRVVNDHLSGALAKLMHRIIACRHKPHGIWELRTDWVQALHTKAML